MHHGIKNVHRSEHHLPIKSNGGLCTEGDYETFNW